MRGAAALILAALAASCGGAEEPDEVRVFAASSLTEVMQTIAADFEKETGVKVKLNLASSSTLAKQIVEGAPCDVFLSADREWADYVEKAGLVEPATRRDLLTNSLVLVMGREWLPPAVTLGDRPADRVTNCVRYSKGAIAMGDPAHVPAGAYAKTAFKAMGLWTDVESRIVPCESVRAALALAERGEVPMAVVYVTDAARSDKVHHAEPFSRVPGVDIRYPVLGVRGMRGGARSFVRFLEGPRAGDIFHGAGFGFAKGK